MKKVFILCLSILALTVVSSCGSDSDNEEIEDVANPIVGKWVLDQEQAEIIVGADGETYDHWKGNYESFRIGYSDDDNTLDTLFFSNPKFKQELLFTNKGKLKSRYPFTLEKDYVLTWMPFDADYEIVGNYLHLKFTEEEENEDGKFEKVNRESLSMIEFDDDFNTMIIKDITTYIKVLQVYKRKK